MPIDFTGREDYLRRLSSARRKDLRRKQRTADALDLEVLPFGDGRFLHRPLQEEMYGMYREVFDQSDIHFDLLGADFFAALTQSRHIEGVVVCYRHKDILAGYNICLIHKGMLIDKYIGFRYPLARELNLYFVSWLFNLDFALREGLNMYVAGWTDPEVKAGLGARFTFTRHLVWVKNPVLRRILKPLRGFFEADFRVLEGAR
jgi:predicted N-acyltransferase